MYHAVVGKAQTTGEMDGYREAGWSFVTFKNRRDVVIYYHDVMLGFYPDFTQAVSAIRSHTCAGPGPREKPDPRVYEVGQRFMMVAGDSPSYVETGEYYLEDGVPKQASEGDKGLRWALKLVPPKPKGVIKNHIDGAFYRCVAEVPELLQEGKIYHNANLNHGPFLCTVSREAGEYDRDQYGWYRWPLERATTPENSSPDSQPVTHDELASVIRCVNDLCERVDDVRSTMNRIGGETCARPRTEV